MNLHRPFTLALGRKGALMRLAAAWILFPTFKAYTWLSIFIT